MKSSLTHSSLSLMSTNWSVCVGVCVIRLLLSVGGTPFIVCKSIIECGSIHCVCMCGCGCGRV